MMEISRQKISKYGVVVALTTGLILLITMLVQVVFVAFADVRYDRDQWFATDPYKDNTRWRMALHLQRNGTIIGKSQRVVEAMFGEPYMTDNTPPYEMTYYYYVGENSFSFDLDKEVLLILGFANGKVVRVTLTGM